MGRTACTESKCLYKGGLYLTFFFTVNQGTNMTVGTSSQGTNVTVRTANQDASMIVGSSNQIMSIALGTA